METAYHLILRQADDIASQLNNKPFIEEFYNSLKDENESRLFDILNKGPKELILVKLYRIVLKLSLEGFSSSYTKYIAQYIAWYKATRPESFNADIFNEINFLFLLGFRISIKLVKDLDSVKDFIESAIVMIDNGADSTPYKTIVLYKLRTLIWNLIINPIAKGSCDQREIIVALSCLSLAQCRGLSDEKIINLTVSQVLRYIKMKFDYYSRSSNQIDANQEAKEINYYLGNIRIKSESLILELNNVITRYGIKNDTAKTEEVNIKKIGSNTILTRDRLQSFGSIHRIREKPPFYNIKFKRYEFIYKENEKIIIAAKVYKILGTLQKDQVYNKINKEIEYYQQLSKYVSDENCFLTYYGTIYKDNKIYLCMDYYKDSLENKIEDLSRTNSKFSETQIEQFVHQMIKSFEHMERLNLYHRDIKPSNFLFTLDNQLKIIDFGESETKYPDESITIEQDMKVVGSRHYMAPELCKAHDNKQKLTKGSRAIADVYSLGMTILRMASCQEILNLNLEESQPKLENFINSNISEKWLKDLLKKMLTYDYTKRPRFSQCLSEIHNSETINN